MELNANDRPILKKYREPAIWGGCALGALIGTLIGGPQFASWSEPIKTYMIYIVAGAAIGMLLGYICYIFLYSGLSDGAMEFGRNEHHDNVDDNAHSLPNAENEGHD
ncbi:MAG: hypothetical protein K2X63_02430 [Burkholderiaceae bacterium]|jgi:hypothetical protein|nr:hypothetical protein [Burkholderiaceae bacterium]